MVIATSSVLPCGSTLEGSAFRTATTSSLTTGTAVAPEPLPPEEAGAEEPPELVFGDSVTLEARSVFRWDGLFLNQRGQYLKLSVDEGNFFLNEIACFDEGQNLISPISVMSENSTAPQLFDEQEQAVYAYTWYDGTYFDEV